MKAKNAAAIFDPMALDLLLPIVRGMRETKVAAIVAEMDPAKARALTAELAREASLPRPVTAARAQATGRRRWACRRCSASGTARPGRRSGPGRTAPAVMKAS